MRTMLHRKPANRWQHNFSRQARIEMLEPRWVLSAPAVADVNICSTDWATEFIDYLETAGMGTDGYSIPAGSSEQLKTLPWINLDQVRITFSEDVDVQMGDLSLSGVNQTAYSFSDFSYDSNTYTATWTLPEPIGKDKLLIDLDANGIDPIEDASNNVLDGEWVDSASTYNSGNGMAGGDFEFRFNVLPGDGYASNGVNIIDAMFGNMLRGKDVNAQGYNVRYDVDGDGEITLDDCNAMYSYIGDSLPAGDPVGVSNDAPTTAGFADVNVDENAADEVLSLFDAFDDAEDDDDDLTYSIVYNSNPDLFDSVDIDGVNGELTLDFAFDEFGEALLTIRATDSNGLIVDTTLEVNVESTNQAPVISNFVVWDEGDDVWTIEGRVTDVDDDVEGMVVTLGGVLAEYNLTATVQADGTFSVTKILAGLSYGVATAQTEDDEGAESNLAQTYVVTS